jgi:putative membrane protein
MQIAIKNKWIQGWPESRSIAVLIILYAVGITGVALSIHPDFLLLTPVNLLISLVLVLYHHPQWSRSLWLFLPIAWLWGFAAELFGVQTGLLFGDYQYGRVLGWKVWDTPLMIGVNWAMLAYCTGITANHALGQAHWLWRGLLASVLMVLLDVFIEPVAMRYDFWSWAGGAPPLQNYTGWFLVAFPLLSWFASIQTGRRNKVALVLLALQFIFFITLNVL